jgi:hypothetical protein
MNESMKTINMEVEEPVRGITLDSNGKPTSGCSVVELFDELDAEFVRFYGEYGRRLVNERRREWNEDGTWHFDLL